MSTENPAAVTTPTPDAPPAAPAPAASRADLIAAVKAKLEGEEPAAAPADPAPESAPPTEAAPPKLSQLYETVADRDATIRELKQQLEAAQSAGGEPDLSALSTEQLWDVLSERAATEAAEETEGQGVEAAATVYDEKIAALEARLEKYEKAEAARKDKAVKDDFHSANHAFIEANSESYPLIRALRSKGSYQRVLDHAIEFVQAYGKAPDQKILLDVVEETLRKEKRAEYDEYSAIFGQTVPTETKTENPARTASAAPSRTLDDAPLEGTPVPRAMTRDERRQRALAIMRGQKLD